ncbi:MAG: DUF4062 domain-containing protein [Clostridia bacterium]|nr:DUF4062 domain-containing protein [Clostridia bacterium]
MSSSVSFNPPPVIRVFLSSTFADMDQERSYFNEVIAPKISRICSDRGVSFFSVDLRWGITREEQVDGKVLPICLSEIDKCRPYFIGIIGNRYGSILETVPEHISRSIPWLRGKEGSSITELEMLYAVLDHGKNAQTTNSAFYFRSDALSKELYGSLPPEDSAGAARLNELKTRIAEDESVSSTDYDSIEAFGELVMSDLLRWLDANFPKTEDTTGVRRKWYNSEILRSYIESEEKTSFLHSYLSGSRKPLLIYGDGARGKTTLLTAWQPLNGHKILINCGADDSYSYWPIIAREIVNSLNERDGTVGSPDQARGSSSTFQLTDAAQNADGSPKKGLNSDFYFVTDSERERFRTSFVKWIRGLKLKEEVTVVIGDLNLLDDEKSKLLSWLPTALPDKLSIICTTNDDEMVKTASLLGWNVKEMPLFEKEKAKQLIREYLHAYGKNLSAAQFEKLVSSVVTGYPGQLRFAVLFLINYGRFDNLDRLIEVIAKACDANDIYQYVYEYLIEEYSAEERQTVRTVLGLVRGCNLSLSERECFLLSQKTAPCTTIQWSQMCRFFEQFDMIKGDYWNIRNEELKKFVDRLLSEQERREVHSLLGDHFLEKLKADNKTLSLQSVREHTALAKECLFHYQNANDWNKLLCTLEGDGVLDSLSRLDWYCVQSAWVKLFLHSDQDISESLLRLIESRWQGTEDDKRLALKLGALLKELGFQTRLDELYRIVGEDQNLSSDSAEYTAQMISDAFFPVYNKLYEMKAARDFRGLHRYVTEQLVEKDRFNDGDLCQLLFFKADAEEQLNLVDEGIKTTSDYYLTAIKAGFPKEMLRALSMRGNVLFRRGQYEEAMLIHQKVARISLAEGSLREYLAALNTMGMCHYRMARYDESIAIFDKLISYWKKLSDPYEIGFVTMNRCNALYLGGNRQEALTAAEAFYSQIADDPSLKRVCTSLLGNMGHYASELKLYDKAESYLSTAAAHAKALGLESPLLNAYSALIRLYTASENFIKIIELRKEQMELLWSRRDYASVMDALQKTVEFLLRHKYISQAKGLENHWKERFSAIPDGLKFFVQQVDAHTVDRVKLDKIKEDAVVAKSEGNILREAELYFDLAQMLQSSNKAASTEYLLDAASLYQKAGNEKRYFDCIEHSVILQFDQGTVADEVLCEKILKYAENESINGIVDLWKRLGKGCVTADPSRPSSQTKLQDLYRLIRRLLTHLSRFESLVVSCLGDVSRQIVCACTAEELIEIVNEVPEARKETVVYDFCSVMKENFDQNHAVITRDYLSPESVEKIEFYEKCIAFLEHFENLNAAPIAGNLALVFRRRKDKEKTLYYHSISIKAYEKAEKKRDLLIEMMNMATAYREFGDLDQAIELLRKGLREATLCKEEGMAASIAGNLASVLIKSETDAEQKEILRCFDVEETYFRSVGNERDLAISLLNQIIYLHNKADGAIWKPKLSELSAIVRSNNFKEFMPTLSKLEWIASKDGQASEEEDEAAVRKKMERLLSAGDAYFLRDVKAEGDCYRVVFYPKEEEPSGAEQVHIKYDRASRLQIQVYCAYVPTAYQKENVESVQEYVDWWNKQNKYSMLFNDSKRMLMCGVDLVAQSWEDMTDQFHAFLKLWEVDKTGTQALLSGQSALSLCQGAKLKALHPDE